MQELIFYARGGQGAVTAAKIMVNAALLDGQYAQSVPSFGQERKGAPVYTYARLSHEPIFIHSYVYQPDCVVAFDLSLLDLGVNIHAGAKSGGILVANAASLPDGIGQYGKVGYVDAWAVTHEFIGQVPPNAAMLGAIAKTTGWFRLEALVEALTQAMPGSKGQRNIACAKAAYERTEIYGLQ